MSKETEKRVVKRDENGKFLPGGSPVSPGRPKREIEVTYLAVLHETVTLDDWRKICATAVSLAMAGDYRSREWIADYLIGKPPQILEISASDATLLKQVLEGLEKRGIEASTLFSAMLTEMTMNESSQEGEGEQ